MCVFWVKERDRGRIVFLNESLYVHWSSPALQWVNAASCAKGAATEMPQQVKRIMNECTLRCKSCATYERRYTHEHEHANQRQRMELNVDKPTATQIMKACAQMCSYVTWSLSSHKRIPLMLCWLEACLTYIICFTYLCQPCHVSFLIRPRGRLSLIQALTFFV